MKAFTLTYIDANGYPNTIRGLDLCKHDSLIAGMVTFSYETDNKVDRRITIREADIREIEQDESVATAPKPKPIKVTKKEPVSFKTLNKEMAHTDPYKDVDLMFRVASFLADQPRSGLYQKIDVRLGNLVKWIENHSRGNSVGPRVSDFRTLGKWLNSCGTRALDLAFDGGLRKYAEGKRPAAIIKTLKERMPQEARWVDCYTVNSQNTLEEFV